MNDTNVFTLAQIIRAAGRDPADITSALWKSGYQKPSRNAAQAVAVTLEILNECYVNSIPPNLWPDSWDEVQMSELNNVVAGAEFNPGSTAVNIAKAVLQAGYGKEADSD